MNNPNAPNVLVRLSLTDNFVAISTYCRRHGRRGRFLIARERIRQLLNEEHASLLDTDCGHHVRIRQYNATLHITFDWLSEYGDGTLKGFRQHVDVPCEIVLRLLETGEPVAHLYKPHEARAHIDACHIGQAIREIRKDPLARRALCKAMRDCFHWNADTVTLYKDWNDSFFFRTASGCPACGGLVLHRTTVSTPVGARPRYSYGVHT